jgi:glycosyltransferase involved in cell wall biosynthesis/2-polyprenyl-3-methyl-5-hydroxy-6-metoxy-1,4-benzoquinol methylase
MRGRSYDSFIDLLKDKDFLQLKIAEINACGALHSYLKIHPNLYYSEWLDNIKPGEVHDGIRCEDLQQLSYPDGFFDIILTSETLEHVPDPDRAWREISRALKVGGYHIFTISVSPSQPTTVKRANLVDGKRQSVLEPAYHGAWGDDNMFVYTDFGMDVVDKLDGIGLKTEVFYQNKENELDVAVVFRSRKSKENWEATPAGESNLLEWTGERYLPSVEEASIGYEHLHRYAYATQFVANKKVLDLASGEGYGSYLLSRGAEFVVGVDIDKKTIRHARNKYIKSNLQFKTGTITDIPIEGRNIFDLIVCFEVIEHIDDHENLLKEVKRLLTKDGLFIVSIPNKWTYSDEPKYENPFHVHELYLDEFTKLFEKYFRLVKILGQRIYCNSNIWPIFSGGYSRLAEYVVERNSREFAFVEGDKRIPSYFIALASDAAVTESASNLVDISNELLKQKDVTIGNLIAARDISIKAQQQALEERDQQLNQLVAAQRRALTAERDRFKQEAEQLLATIQGQQHSMERISEEIYQLQNSESYRFGLFCTWPLRKLWRFTRGLVEGRELTRVQNDKVSPEPEPSSLGESKVNVDAEVGEVPKPLEQTQEPQSALPGTARHRTAVLDEWLEEWYSEDSDYYEPMSNSPLEETEIRLIAFYLPQFHPIPDNDWWWRKGFTEWTNVTKAKPQYVGHYQPHLPGELGFYDLRLIDVQKRQIEIAKHYGIHGFCYYHYWFSGKRLFERPLDQVLRHPELDFPFCICWANENWTRRWDGLDNEVLIAQTHSPQDDLAFIESVGPMLRDKRYIRVNGRALLIVYRPSLLPNPLGTAQRWRDYCAKNKLGGLYLVAVQAFETVDPRSLGFDAAVEFPPHKLAEGAPVLNEQMEIVNPDYQGVISDYSYMVESAKKIHRPDFTLFRGVCPSWDNDARKPGRGITYQNSTPALYQEWLAEACRYTAKEPDQDKRLVFVNAWNNWSEGAYLEPDKRYGYAYLQATANALERFANSQVQRELQVVFVSHDAANAGAQRLLITLIEWLRDNKDIQPKIILRHGGPLVAQFYRLGPVLEMDSISINTKRTKEKLVRFCGQAKSLIYINTLVPGDVAEQLASLHIPIITHVHELENAIKRWCVKEHLEALIRSTDHFIAASPPVARNLENAHDVDPARITTIYEYIACQKQSADRLDRVAIRKQRGLPNSGSIIFGCGTTDWRKGPDIFIEVADQAKTLGLEDAYFLWIGVDTGEVEELEAKVRRLGLKDRVRFLGETQDARSYFAAGDLFLLTSREDPFPLVCLEAADCGLPIICFDKAGGMPDFVQDDAGYVVPFEDTGAMAEKLIALCFNREERVRRGAIACQRVRARHDISVAGQEIFDIIAKFRVKPGEANG